MNALRDGFAWLRDPLSWTNPGGLLDRLGEHLLLSALALFIGCLVAVPWGIWLGHRRRGGGVATVLSRLALAVSALAVLIMLSATPLGVGRLPVVAALSVFAVPSLLDGAYKGIRGVDPESRAAAIAMGLTAAQLLRSVELPLALPGIAAGLRAAARRVVAATALAALVDGGGLGQIIVAGLRVGPASDGAARVVAGGLAVVALVLLVDGVSAAVQRAVTPRPLRTGRLRAAPVAALPG